jgi:hypothetical protein
MKKKEQKEAQIKIAGYKCTKKFVSAIVKAVRILVMAVGACKGREKKCL